MGVPSSSSRDIRVPGVPGETNIYCCKSNNKYLNNTYVCFSYNNYREVPRRCRTVNVESRAKEAVALENLGLTKNEASTFLSLSKLGRATASEIHEESGVPRSNVYGVLDKLAEKGLIEVHQSRPSIYRALNPDEAIKRLKEKRRENEDEALEVLKEAASDGDGGREKGEVWTILGRENVLSKAKEIIRATEDEFLIADYPGIVEEIERDIVEASADHFLITTADTALKSTGFPENLQHPVKMNGFVVLGEGEVMVSFEGAKERLGIWSDSEGLFRFFEHFLRSTIELGE